jgi:restriction system protein
VSLVFANSAYPADFPVEHDFEFDPATAELRLRVLVPAPDKVPSTNTYKYAKSSDEITSTSLSQKACKDRFAGAVHQVALRSVHEVFEADRRGHIKTISLEVGTETIDPATGKETYVLFVATGAERDAFLELDLANVVPTATLGHLGASLSKNPFGLVAADGSGVRRS